MAPNHMGMMSYEIWHWRIYNVLRRTLAVLMMFVGLAFVGDGTGLAQRLGLMDVEPGPPRSAWEAAGMALMGFALVLVGLYLCRLRTYRPDLGDVSWWAGKAGGYAPGRTRPGAARSWLTGDPRAHSDERRAT